jgi:hypothetical protein
MPDGIICLARKLKHISVLLINPTMIVFIVNADFYALGKCADKEKPLW